MDFCQTFVARDKDELMISWDQKVKGQGHSMTKYAKTKHGAQWSEAYRAQCCGFEL